MAKLVTGILVVVALAAIVPFGLIALARSKPSPTPPMHPIMDMVKQPKFRAQRENPMFADTRAMRPRIPGVEALEDLTVPSEVLNDPEFARMVGESQVAHDAAAYQRLTQGIERQADGHEGFVTQIPVPVTMEMIRRGQERFNVYCAVCHGLSGYGDGMVARRAAEMQSTGADTAAGWVAPTNYHTDDLRARPVGNLYNTVANGIRTMPAYGKQVSILDRWAIVAYVKALQRSQNAKGADVPETQREHFSK